MIRADRDALAVFEIADRQLSAADQDRVSRPEALRHVAGQVQARLKIHVGLFGKTEVLQIDLLRVLVGAGLHLLRVELLGGQLGQFLVRRGLCHVPGLAALKTLAAGLDLRDLMSQRALGGRCRSGIRDWASSAADGVHTSHLWAPDALSLA